jgi:N-acetylglutamate synthase-like GNAT family acetyltransferase
MEIRIREIKPEDCKAVNELSKQLGYVLSLDHTKAQIIKLIAGKEHGAFAAIAEEKLIGWIHPFITLAIETKPFVEIAGLVVDEKFRDKGVGKRLVKKICEWSMLKEMDTIRVRCNTKRIQSHLFYQKIGFNELKEQKVFLLNL